jgi:putative Mg2+ transporter-C (MgtC) family protein
MEIAIKLFLSVLVGGIVGAEREYRDKAAGFRTILLITLGATVFTIISDDLAGLNNDPGRVAAGIVTGVGFLGGGVIFKHNGNVTGITTAATIWVAAALGMGIGAGEYATSLAAFAIMMVVLVILPRAEALIDIQSEQLTYRIVSVSGQSKLEELRQQFFALGLKVRSFKEAKDHDRMITYFSAGGPQVAHRAVMKALYEDPEVVEFET